MATKKTTKTTAKGTNNLGKFYIAVDEVPDTCTDPKGILMDSIVDGEYYQANTIGELMEYLLEDGIEDNKGIYEVSFWKVGRVDKPVLEFKSE